MVTEAHFAHRPGPPSPTAVAPVRTPARPAAHPAVRPAAHPAVRPAAHPAVRPAACPARPSEAVA